MTVLLVVLGAALGAPARYLADRYVQIRHDSVFPWGTLTVNVSGSFLLGLSSGLVLAAPLAALLNIGFLGAFTTYSTFGYETLRLGRSGAGTLALLNVVATLTAGLGAAYCGLALARVLTG